MRIIPPDLAAELASGTTTFCRCWKAIRRDGVAFGFTDHDRDLTFNSITFQAQSGLEASEAESALGLAVGGGEVSGALVADAIREEDIAAGLWDGAAIETWLVDWRDVTRRLLLDTGQIGDISRRGESFTAEIRSLAHLFDQEQGRRYQALCSAELGDTRCTVALNAASRRVVVQIISVVDPSSFSVALLTAFGVGAFTGGTVKRIGGIGDGLSLPIMSHTRVGNQDVIALWAPPAQALTPGQSVALTVGCDKRFETCCNRFNNGQNFRGFPHIPGNDFAMGYARQGEVGLDGSALIP
jgi:uncharacterized phage protein (TIGR02218 family)